MKSLFTASKAKCFILATCFLGVIFAANAQSTFNIETASATPETTSEYSWDGTVLTVLDGANITITGTVNNGRRVVVASGATADVTFNDLSITQETPSPFDMAGATVNLHLDGTNTLNGGTSSSNGDAALHCSEGSTLVIDGTGSLTASNSYYGAAIGGSVNENAGTITINSGTIMASCDQYAAAIGGGRVGNGGNITINGGTVTATNISMNAIGGGVLG
ncbi:MAG: carbohydrate-binding domain-containing protein, partial [Bacteroidales bacterium]|nr:carbohydrate-binding domain-containing protein [Bacteroidales bacterium]